MTCLETLERGRKTHLFPTLNLCFGVDAWDGVISSCTMGYDRGLCDQQGPWCRTALRIVGDLPGPGGMRGTCSKLGQRGKNNAVLKYYPANSDGFEERGCLPSRRHGWQWSGRAISEEALWDSAINCRDCMLTRFIGTQGFNALINRHLARNEISQKGAFHSWDAPVICCQGVSVGRVNGETGHHRPVILIMNA